MDFGDDQFLVDLVPESEPQLVLDGQRRTSKNEQHMQHAGLAMGSPLPLSTGLPTHQFVPIDNKMGHHSPGSPYGQAAMPFGAIMPNGPDPAAWRAGTATPDSPGLPFQGLTLQSPSHSTGIGAHSPFDANGSTEVMGGMMQPASGMMMAPPLHTVASGGDGSPFVTTPQSNSPPLMNMNAVQAALPMMMSQQQMAALTATLHSQINNAIHQQQSMVSAPGATSPSLPGGLPMTVGARSGSSTPTGGADRLMQHGNNLVLSSDRDKLLYTARSDNDAQRSQRQQLQNKQAQARYRERQKAKVADMERTITELTKQVSRVKELEEEATSLREAKALLTHQLELRNRTVADLRAALQAAGADGAAVTSAHNTEGMHTPSEGGAVSGGGAAGIGDGSTSHSELSVPTGLVECQTQLQEAVAKLHRFLESHQLMQAPVSATLASSQARQLGRHLEDICTRQTRVLSARCSNATDDLCHLTVHALDQAGGARAIAPWHAVVASVEVTKWQSQNVAALRAAYLHKLLALYTDRQSILNKVLNVAMPSQPGTVSPGGTLLPPPPPADSDAMEESEDMEPGSMHVAALRVNGMVFAVEQRVKVSHTVARLRESLASEVKLLADFNKVILTCVLSPMQAAKVLCSASTLAVLTGVGLANALHNLEDGSFSSIPLLHQQAGSPAPAADAGEMHVEGSGESLPDNHGRVSPEMGKRARDPGDANTTGPGNFHSSSPGPHTGTSPPPSPRRPSDSNVAKFSRTSPQGPLP